MTDAAGGRRGFARAAGLISSATMLSRVLGLARDQLFAALMGASLYSDAFVAAFRIPNLLRDLFAEGALSQAFVPAFKAELKLRGPGPAHELASRLAGNLALLIGALLVLAGLFTGEIVGLLAGEFAGVPGKFELTVLLTRIMLPFLLLISLAAVAMGMLNAQERYGAPALAPAMFNVASIATGALLYAIGVEGRAVAIGWAVGTLLGGLAQLVVQLPPLWRLGFRPRARADLRLRDPAMRRIARQLGPAVIGLAAVQVNVFVNTGFAASDPGAVSWLNYAFRFLQLPIGVFGVAIATVAMTRFSDAAADRDHARMARQLTDGLRLVLFLTVPATVGLYLQGEPVIQLLFERGKFTHADTLATTRALELYITGLVAYAGVKVLAPAFYAVDRVRVPVIASVLAVATNVALNVGLHPIYGWSILALGTAAAALLNFLVLFGAFQLTVDRTHNAELAGHALRVTVASGAMAAAVWGCQRELRALIGASGLPARLALALVPVGVGVAVYAAACHALRVPELAAFTRRVRRSGSGTH